MATTAAATTPTPIPAFAPVDSELEGSGLIKFVAVAVKGLSLVEMDGVEELVAVVVLMMAAVVDVP